MNKNHIVGQPAITTRKVAVAVLTSVGILASLVGAPSATADDEHWDEVFKAMVCVLPAFAFTGLGKYVVKTFELATPFLPEMAGAAAGKFCEENYNSLAEGRTALFDIQTHKGTTVTKALSLQQFVSPLTRSTRSTSSNQTGISSSDQSTYSPQADVHTIPTCDDWGPTVRDMCLNGEIDPPG